MTAKDKTRITLDATRISVVVRCTGCPWWFGFALDKVEAWTVGARHQRTHHALNQQAEQNLLRARKHAAAGIRD